MMNKLKTLLGLVFLSTMSFVVHAQGIAHPTADRSVEVTVDQIASPEYNWGEYLTNTLKYPDEAVKKNLQGKVVVELMVDVDGNLKDVKVVRGEHKALNEEALRIVKNAPKWKPAMKNDQAVKSYLTLPINFKIQ